MTNHDSIIPSGDEQFQVHPPSSKPFSELFLASGGVISLALPSVRITHGALSLSFHLENGHLLTIHPDGKIERGPAFTTEDQASVRFWEIVAQAFPQWAAGAITPP